MNAINWNELTLENAGQWPISVKNGLLLGVSFLIISFGYWLIIQANFTQYAALKAQEIALKVVFESKQQQASQMQAYRTQVQELNDRFAAMLRQFPEKNQIPALLEEVTKTGLTSGLKFELFAPQAAVTHDFYIELPIKIIVTGTYFQLATFLSRLAEMNRIITLHEFTVAEASFKDNSSETIQKPLIRHFVTPSPRVRGEGKKESSYLEDDLVMCITAKIYRYSMS